MDNRQFRYFIAAAEELHFGRAAERLGIAQPALSQQIKSLETQVGVMLFSRARKRVELTEAGAAFLVEARATVASAERAVSVAQDTARGEMGKIVIGFVGSAMFKPAFPQMLKEYRVRHPRVQLDLIEMANKYQLESLVSHHLDIAIVRGVAPGGLPEDLGSFLMARHRLLLVLPANHPHAGAESLDLAKLSREFFLALDDLTQISLAPELIRLCRAAGFEPDIRLRLREIATLVHLVGAGHGVALLPELARELNLPDVAFVPLKGPQSFSDLLVVHRKFERSAAVKSLLAQIRKSSPF